MLDSRESPVICLSEDFANGCGIPFGAVYEV